MILSKEEPEEWDCPNYDDHQMEKRLQDEGFTPFEKPITIKWEGAELKERYRIAYHLRGGTWEGQQESSSTLSISRQASPQLSLWC